mmetsp:Transcript_48046/g.124807  ORF Transcript_48046/g.124807 Transcript_48046/m.124807 type:complete len:206 (+) Transcript_48046:758-1375(+)
MGERSGGRCGHRRDRGRGRGRGHQSHIEKGHHRHREGGSGGKLVSVVQLSHDAVSIPPCLCIPAISVSAALIHFTLAVIPMPVPTHTCKREVRAFAVFIHVSFPFHPVINGRDDGLIGVLTSQLTRRESPRIRRSQVVVVIRAGESLHNGGILAYYSKVEVGVVIAIDPPTIYYTVPKCYFHKGNGVLFDGEREGRVPIVVLVLH